ncbi:MAG: sodium:solute symporter [Betaproteobacteria bacterium RIFCSPLOWO2_02_FULL_67_26]|nr:MAG: sodium:solute symporter [Betaproteobacteria bacterium RIFCSPLOWO2_02_FULL_67_26]
MSFDPMMGLYFWGFLVLYGGVMYAMSPSATTVSSFFRGTDNDGRPASEWALMMSIFISWIFAKSVTNAANLGAAYGVVGGLAYATYWLSLPVAGIVIYWLRTRHGARGLVPFLIERYGRTAALAFALAIFIRLYNEVWSNTAVVGAYYGKAGEWQFIAAAFLFTAVTLFYSIKGGLRSSIVTDIVQGLLFIVVLGIVLFLVLPQHGTGTLLAAGEFRLAAGVDLILVAALQVLSYPFHDPVLTDRGFITEEKSMLRAMAISGVLGFICIFGFSLVGVHAKLEGLPSGDNVPGAVAAAFGAVPYLLMTMIMIVAAGSTLDSTFASVSKLVGQEVPLLAGRRPGANALKIGVWTMIAIAMLGNLPMIAGTDILKATTVSGTMVMGLAPVFLLAPLVRYSPWSFHLAFWPGVILGILLAASAIPQSWAIGTGQYALLLGANLYGLAICFAGFLLPLAWQRLAARAAA